MVNLPPCFTKPPKMPNLQRGRLRAPHSVKRVGRTLLYIRPLALPHEPALVRAVEKEVGDLRRLGRHVRQLRRGRHETAPIVWVVLPMVALERGASVCHAARRRNEMQVRGRASVSSGVQAFVMSTLCASASWSEARNGKGPFFIAPIQGMGISTSAVCSVSVFFSSKPCTAWRRAQSVRQQRTQQPVSGPFVPSFETWHNEKWAESSQACPCT